MNVRLLAALTVILAPSSLYAAVLGNIGYDTTFVADGSFAAIQNLGNGTFSNGERVTGVDIRIAAPLGGLFRPELRSFLATSDMSTVVEAAYQPSAGGENVFHFDLPTPFIPEPSECYVLMFYQFSSAPNTTFYGWGSNQYTASTTGCHPTYASHNINTALQNPALNGHGMVDYSFQIHTETVQTPPTISNLKQLQPFSTDEITEGASFLGNAIVFKADVADVDSSQARLEVELKPTGTPFNNTGTRLSDLTFPDEVSLSIDELIEPLESVPNGGQITSFHWRARAIDDNDLASEWEEFGTPGNTDFTATYTLGQAASDLAKQVVLDAYTLAGKGWDVVDKNYVTRNLIKTGYYATSSEVLSRGLDCSGLVVWAYNRIFDPLKSFAKNFITDLSANDQFESRKSISEENLLPGDQLFFDWDFDDRVDHVVMYVGGDPEANLVHARDPRNGIESAKLGIYKNLPGFVGFGRPQNTPLALAITAHSPIHLSVIDPDGVTVDHSTVIASETEIIREAGDLRYVTIGADASGHPQDMVYSKVLKEGNYKIAVTPIPGAAPNETYSIEFTAGGQTVALATDVPLAQIPSQGYEVNVGSDEEITIIKTIEAVDDTYVKSGTPNKNQGLENILRVRAAGDNRALVTFDLSEIPTEATVSSAKLVFNIASNRDNWGSNGRAIGAYAMLRNWIELGATWNCGIDSNISNSSDKDCNGTQWQMGKPSQPSLWPYRSTPTGTTIIENGQLGSIEIDVTSDVQNILSGSISNYGWIIRKELEGKTGQIDLSSSEVNEGPRLVVTYK